MNKMVSLAFAAVFLAGALSAQTTTPDQQKAMDAYMKAAAVTANHQALKYFVGRWDASVTMWTTPGAPPSTSKGVLNAALILGGRFVQMAFKGTMMGRPFEGLQVTGYDNMQKTYTTFWIDDSSTAFYILTGPYDAAAKAYNQKGNWADPMGGTTPVRTVTRIVGPDEFVFENYMVLPDGKEFKSMEYQALRRKRGPVG
jgi:hypothetical protein